MSGANGRAFYQLEIYRRYERLSELVWSTVGAWDIRHKRLIGDQLVEACDSIGANIAESIGRGHCKEGVHFLYYSRGSLTETEHWMRLSVRRNLIPSLQRDDLRSLCISLHKQWNSFIRAQKPLQGSKRATTADRVSEEVVEYGYSVSVLEPAPFDRIQEPRAKSQEPRRTRSTL